MERTQLINLIEQSGLTVLESGADAPVFRATIEQLETLLAPVLTGATVWHEGTRAFYEAALLRKLTPAEVAAMPGVDAAPEGPHTVGPFDITNEKTVDDLRRAVARIIGANPSTWPDHGNAPLAIACAVGERTQQLRDALHLLTSAHMEITRFVNSVR